MGQVESLSPIGGRRCDMELGKIVTRLVGKGCRISYVIHRIERDIQMATIHLVPQIMMCYDELQVATRDLHIRIIPTSDLHANADLRH
jgi:hypothetical protein